MAMTAVENGRTGSNLGCIQRIALISPEKDRQSHVCRNYPDVLFEKIFYEMVSFISNMLNLSRNWDFLSPNIEDIIEIS